VTPSHRLPALLLLALALAPFGCGPKPTAAALPPKADFRGGTTLDAGEVDYTPPRDFTFTVANTGGAPLQLKLVRKSCECAEVRVPAAAIAPGADDKVVIRWAPLPGNSGDHDLTATLETNDPAAAAVDLRVKAHIKPLVHLFIEGAKDPSYIDFGDEPIPPGEARTRELKVFTTELPAFVLEATSPAAGLKVETEPLAAGTRLGDREVSCGYTVKLRTTDRLPLGYVRTVLNLALSKLGSQPDRTLTVPVYAVVGNDAYTLSPAALVFRKPNITDEDTAQVNLRFKTPPANESVAVESYEPKFLKVDVPQKLGEGSWRIAAHLSRDSAEAAKFQPDSFMEGQVVLKVAGLDRPVIVRVKWDPVPD
jgi:hypothetical protein